MLNTYAASPTKQDSWAMWEKLQLEKLVDMLVSCGLEASFHMQLDRLVAADSTEPMRPPDLDSDRPNLQVVVLVERHCMNLSRNIRECSPVWPGETLILSEVEAAQPRSAQFELLAIVTLVHTDIGTVALAVGTEVSAVGTAQAK